MRIDLHVHTAPRSPCSNIDPIELIQEAKRIGLDGICLTEHQVLWEAHEVITLGQNNGIKIFRGNEITTAQGDVLVFGLEKGIQGIIPAKKLYEEVKSVNGFAAAAHPFRGFKVFGVGQLGMDLDQACTKKLLQYVDAVEIKNGRVSDRENRLAMEVADRLGLLAIAGSDAHEIEALGTWVTCFEKDIHSETDLIRELREGRFTIESLRRL